MGCGKGTGEALYMQGSAIEEAILASGQSYIVSLPSKLMPVLFCPFLGFFFFFNFLFYFLLQEGL